MTLFNSVVSWILKKRIHQIELFMKYPIDVQNELFKSLIHTAASTEFGQKHNFSKITKYTDFQEQVPIQTYEDIKPYVERIMKGERNLLWPTEVKWFAKSSGTTSDKSKYIPMTNESLRDCHYNAGRDLLSLFFNNNPNAEIFNGKSLVMGGSHKLQEVNESSYYVGDLSAILMQNMPFLYQIMVTPNLSIALMDEWENKINLMAESTINHNVTSITGVPSWTLVLLHKVLEISGKSNINQVWPNLEVFFHGGVSFKPYKSQFQKLIPSPEMKYMETYNASEGFFGIQNDASKDDMLLMLDYGIFFEFIAVQDFNEGKLNTIPLEGVSIGVNYVMIISSNGGLWRYMIGDTITFTSTSPFKIKITGRTKSFVNAVGEELIIDNSDKAIKTACERSNAEIIDYTVAPLFYDDKNAVHEWVIEFKKKPNNIDYFTETLDTALKSLNSDYEAKRYNNMVLRKPIIHQAQAQTFYKWLRKKGKLGGQHKVPRLMNDRSIIDEILEIGITK